MKPRQAVIRFGPVRQDTGSKHVRKGDLLEAINVRQTAKAGVYCKRRGFARTAQTFVGGSLSGTPNDVLPGITGNSFMRDSGDQLWSRSNSANTWTYSGEHRRPWVDTDRAQSGPYTAPCPFSCIVGGYTWIFALTANAYEFSIVESSTGIVNTSKVSVSATNINHASAVYDGANVWVFWVAGNSGGSGNGLVKCHKFTVSTPTVAPTSTTYYQFPASPTDVSTIRLQQVQAKYLPALNKVFVVACGGDFATVTYRRAAMHSVLDPATGLAVVAGGQAAYVSYVYSGTASAGNCAHMMGGLYIADGQDGSNASIYYVFANGNGASGNIEGHRIGVNAAGFSTVDDQKFYDSAVSVATSVSQVAILDTFIDGVGTTKPNSVAVFMRFRTGTTVPAWSHLVRVVYGTGGSIDLTLNLPAATWIASGFTKNAGRWFCVAGSDDWSAFSASIGAETLPGQRCYRVLGFDWSSFSNAKLSAWSQFSMGEASAINNRSSGVETLGAGFFPVTSVVPAFTSSTLMILPLAVQASVAGSLDVSVARIQLAKAFGKSTQLGNKAISAGGIPFTWNGVTIGRELVPLVYPYFLTNTGSTTADYVVVAAVFAFYDSDGTITRSSPRVLSASVTAGATITVPTPEWCVSGSTMKVEMYLGTTATPKLQAVINPRALSTTVWTVPALANFNASGEILYTTGNEPSQAWPVACQAVGLWQNRIFAAQKNVLWVSKEVEPGFGPIFNEVQTSTWNEETSDITAMGTVDFNYLAIFSASKPAVISGQGPDGLGNGNYTIRTLSSVMGVSPGGVALQGPQGCHYQDPGTGRLIVVTPGLQVMDCGGGAWDYSSYVVAAAVWYETENLLVFFAPASNAALVIDYQHPQDVAPFGQMYLWTFAAGFSPAAACMDSAGMLIVSSAGGIYRPAAQWVDDNATVTPDSYRWKLATAELQMGDLQGEINVSFVQAMFTMRSADSVSIDVYPGYASPTLSDARVTAHLIALPAPTNVGDPDSAFTRPANCARVQSFRVVVQEAAGQTGQGAEFEGLAVEYTTSGRAMYPSSGRVI